MGLYPEVKLYEIMSILFFWLHKALSYLSQVNEHTNTYMDCMASWMSCIQVLRSSFELARTSIISGFSIPAVMRKRPRSSFATSLTISFWREMTVERWSYRERRKEKKGRD